MYFQTWHILHIVSGFQLNPRVLVLFSCLFFFFLWSVYSFLIRSPLGLEALFPLTRLYQSWQTSLSVSDCSDFTFEAKQSFWQLHLQLHCLFSHHVLLQVCAGQKRPTDALQNAGNLLFLVPVIPVCTLAALSVHYPPPYSVNSSLCGGRPRVAPCLYLEKRTTFRPNVGGRATQEQHEAELEPWALYTYFIGLQDTFQLWAMSATVCSFILSYPLSTGYIVCDHRKQQLLLPEEFPRRDGIS